LPASQRSLLQTPARRVIRRFADDFDRLGGVRNLEDAYRFAVSAACAAIGIFDVDMFGGQDFAYMSQFTRLIPHLNDHNLGLGKGDAQLLQHLAGFFQFVGHKAKDIVFMAVHDGEGSDVHFVARQGQKDIGQSPRFVLKEDGKLLGKSHEKASLNWSGLRTAVKTRLDVSVCEHIAKKQF